jgi:NAD(P)-dependent dehydrogenase (short-subunit alcohol dehydrogenase family)
MELGLKGKVALVTGSSRGIGQGIALAFAEEGCDLLLTGRDAQALQEVATSIRGKGRKAAVCVLDLREPSAAGTLVAAVQREFDGLDILVNNAGATKRGDFFALTDADWEDGYALKFFAHVRLARAAWPLLKEAKIRAQFCREAGIIRYGKVEDVADFVAFIVSSRATWLHGATLDLDGGEIPVL